MSVDRICDYRQNVEIVQRMTEPKLFNFNLSESERTALMRRAAQMTIKTGRRITMSDLLREAVVSIINSPLDGTDSNTKISLKAIHFIPAANVQRALRQATLNSGKPVDEVINALLAEALQLQEMSL